MKKAGKRLRTDHLEVRASGSPFLHARVAVVVSKHGHNIVERNRLRRRLRELARIRIIPDAEGVDIVIRSLSSAYTATFEELRSEIDTVCLQLSKLFVGSR